MDLKKIIVNNLENRTKEFKRVFHGRGNFYEKYNNLTVDSIDKILFATFFEKYDDEENLIELFKELSLNFDFEKLIVQRRYKKDDFNEVVFGFLDDEEFLVENGIKFKINFSNQNIGFFPDMKKGREFLKEISKDKSVLNLFSYSCSFSVYASLGEASKVVNVDMSKSALSLGRVNHQINDISTKNIKFMPYNILKSWSRIRKEAPFDIIVIDPPSFQKGSFAATKDYEKIVKKLDELGSENSIIISCLNAPELDTSFIKNLFNEFAPTYKFIKRLDNLDEFPTNDSERTLKILIYEKS